MVSNDLDELLATLEAAASRKRFRKLDYFSPYEKQKRFFALGATKRERMLMAGNQQGKTEAGAAETAYHLTGEYPEWWQGRVFAKPVVGWAAGETSVVVRDVQQQKLCGKPGVESEFGTGYIPKEAFADKPSLARGVTDAYDMIQVKHQVREVKKGNYIKTPIVDGVSTLNFKSYEQGRTKFQGTSIDFGWADEEPPEEVYSEFLTRTVATNGIMFMTFTPLKGRSAVVIRFTDEQSPDRAMVNMTIEDALHISPEQRERVVAGYLAHEREARRNGTPLLGSGKIFTTPEDVIKEPMIDALPQHWAKMWAIDFGIGHPFAAVLGAWDKDADIVHILHAIRLADGMPINHAAMMKPIGINVPVAWPQDGTAREKGSGHMVSTLYKDQGLIMLPKHATWPDGSVSTEAGILEMDQRFSSGRLKVASHLSEWFEEYRFYHRKDGQIVKIKDDLMSATRIFLMQKRSARPVNLGGQASKRKSTGMARDIDFDLF